MAAGYPDFRRRVDQTAQTLVNDTASNASATVDYGLTYVGDAQSLIVTAQPKLSSQTVNLLFRWTLDAAGNIVLAERNIVCDGRMGNALQCALPNVGPYVRIIATLGRGATPWSWALLGAISSSVRTTPEVVPRKVQPVTFGPVNLTAGASSQIQATDYLSGSCFLNGKSDITQMLLQVFTLDNTGTPIQAISDILADSNSRVNIPIQLPTNAWGITITNFGAGAANMQATVTQGR